MNRDTIQGSKPSKCITWILFGCSDVEEDKNKNQPGKRKMQNYKNKLVIPDICVYKRIMLSSRDFPTAGQYQDGVLGVYLFP